MGRMGGRACKGKESQYLNTKNISIYIELCLLVFVFVKITD